MTHASRLAGTLLVALVGFQSACTADDDDDSIVDSNSGVTAPALDSGAMDATLPPSGDDAATADDANDVVDAPSIDTFETSTPVDAGVASCTVTGGATIAPIYGPMSTTETACASECASLAAANPNLSCVWGTLDITPTGPCSIQGTANTQLYGPTTDTRAECSSECASLAGANPDRSCTWNRTDITPTAACVVTSAAAINLYMMTDTQEQCAAECTTLTQGNAGSTCTWGMTKLQ